MRPVDFKDEFYSRNPINSNNDLYDVVKPFYCLNKEQGYKDSICDDQCTLCYKSDNNK
jgi:hypothetical protein